METGSLESQAFRKHFGELSHAISDPEWLASELFSEGMISNNALDEVITVMCVSKAHKTRRVLCHFKRTLAGNPECFQKFISTLKSERSLDWIANRVEATYSKFSRGCNISQAFHALTHAFTFVVTVN